jgi:GH24 family phage-related lysozyme (muramidase)
MNRVTYRVALEVACHEAIVRQAYTDSVGVWTWSVGLTNATGHDVTRYIGKPQTLEHCLAIYAWALERYADDVREAFEGHELTEAQFAAALSFHWNTGSIKRASWVRHWKAGDTGTARKRFMDWSKPPEIIPRRQKERDLFFDGKWSNDGTMTEYGVTSRQTPDWRSARKIDVSDALKKAFKDAQQAETFAPAPTPPPRPKQLNKDMKSVTPAPEPEGTGILPLLVSLLVKLFGGK